MDLPRPNVKVSHSSDGKTDLVIDRGGKAKSYHSDHAVAENVIRDLVEQILADHHTAEWLPRR
jgi:hypothetical protein